MKQLEYLDKLEAEEESLMYDSDSPFVEPGPRGDKQSKTSSDYKQDSCSLPQYKSRVGRISKQRLDDQSERDAKTGGIGQERELEKSFMSVGANDIAGSTSSSSLPQSLSTSISKFHKFSPRSFSNQIQSSGTASPNTMNVGNVERLSMSPIHHEHHRAYAASNTHTNGSMPRHHEFEKREMKLVRGQATEQAIDSRSSALKIAAKGRDLSNEWSRQSISWEADKSAECLEESVDEESSALDIDDPFKPSRSQSYSCQTGKSIRSRNVLQSVNRR